MSRYRPKGRPRTFDWAEAKRLRSEGLSYVEIGRRLGVSDNAVACACDPGYRNRQRRKSRALAEEMRHPCFGGCGVLVWGHQNGRSGYCRRCLGERRNVVRHGTANEYKQGCRCRDCTTAAAEAKRQHREKTRVPCSHGCGTLVDATNRRTPDKPPECRPCSLQRIRAERRAGAAA